MNEYAKVAADGQIFDLGKVYNGRAKARRLHVHSNGGRPATDLAETAIAICRMLVLDWDGEEECRRQEPLIAEDGSNVWNIRGSLLMKPDAIPGDPVPVRMSISKFDGAIVSLTGSAP